MNLLNMYNLNTNMAMLEPWERLIFNSVVAGLTAMSTYTIYTYGPDYLRRTAELFA
ncbi:hypothetical protein CAOG_02361 [Capsaspora owczarzaki ATCC 30864]|uniref:Uncharacterized protein n=1 Tax=Capsaspora owczarzaki (strain ATCC 30864) TaxID=595528 RepID=A0A0D2U7Y1_CAPO3|nr:hypothetical protein CAOG_02361 [Capsaspora owczarzaki ATCC 30864]KJE91196.1 hypothetical protein CAOG_002361 [Capsaspora owczarzaki ATCC 30864]|eukprot:XP_004349111.1 hypothetical protein CAOG_02361 [Capsaspora owczarzaki ATCC 30864]